MRRRATAAVTACAVLLAGVGALMASPQHASALTLQQAEQKLQALQQKIRSEEAQLRQTRNSIAQDRQLIAEIHQNLDAANLQLQLALNEEATLGRRARAKEHEIRVTTGQLDRDLAVVGQALRAVQQEGTGGYLNVLLSAQSFNDFESRLSLVAQLVTSDMDVVRSVRDLRARLVREHSQLVSLRAQYHRAAQDRARAKAAVQQQYMAQQQAIAQLDQQYAQTQSAIHTDQGNSAEITQILQELEGNQQGAGIGNIHFIWPVIGPITSPFGWRLDPVVHKWWIHTGIDIGVPWGTPIRAAAAGTVIVAQWLNGYGYTIIVYDGGGVANLYAHQSRFNAYVGEQVQQGEVIGYVGATGWATGPHLHFEVRINGKPVNPMPYMPPMP